MRRRAVLSTLAATCSLPLLGSTTAQTDPYEPLGRVPIEGAAEAVVGDDGLTAYVAATNGFVVVDVSDPADPAPIAEERGLTDDGAPLVEILDVALDGDRLAVVGPANSGDPQGLFVYDVSEPSEPVPASDFYATDFPIHNCFLDGDSLYLSGNDGDRNPLVVLDVAGEPEEVGRWSLIDHDERWADVRYDLRFLHDVFVRDDVAYLAHWDAGTWLVDVSDPTAPVALSSVGDHDLVQLTELNGDAADREYWEPPGNSHYAAVDETGALLGIGKESWAHDSRSDGGPSGIELWDVTDPAAPEHRSTIDPPETPDPRASGVWTTAHNFELVGSRLLSSWYQAGVKVHDVSDPSEPVELASWRDPVEAAFWTARVAGDGEFFVASSYAMGHNETRGALYTFPNRAGEQPDPPPMDGRATPTPTETETGSGPSHPGDGTPTATETSTPTPEPGSIPGFSAVTALAGLGVGAWAAHRLDTDGDEER